MFAYHTSALLGLAFAIGGAGASAAQGAMYSPLSAGNFQISDISDNNGAYGQPTLDASGLMTFTNTNFGFASGSNGGSGGISYRLTFKVTLSDGPMAPGAELSEFGLVNQLGTGGAFQILPQIALFNDPIRVPPVAIDSATGAVVFSGKTWTADVAVGGAAGVNAFWVVVDNDFLTQGNVGGTVLIDKKLVVIRLGENTTSGGDVPEPASLGVLGLGAMALLARRRG